MLQDAEEGGFRTFRDRASSASVLCELLRFTPRERSSSLVRSPVRLDSGYLSPALLSLARLHTGEAFPFPGDLSSPWSAMSADNSAHFNFDSDSENESSSLPSAELCLPTAPTSQRTPRAPTPLMRPACHPTLTVASAPTTPARRRFRPHRSSAGACLETAGGGGGGVEAAGWSLGPAGNPCRSISTQTSVDGAQCLAARRGKSSLV